MIRHRIVAGIAGTVLGVIVASPALAQHEHHRGAAPATGQWTWMYDAITFAMVNHQGGARGGTEFVLPHWWMGVASRSAGRHQITFTGMLSADAATVGRDGYRELFQAGEVLDGVPLVDRQHPHDFLMQLAGIWRLSLGEQRSLAISGALSGEPTLGPIAFMHRASAAGLPMAPLGHHNLDSTHVAFGVVAAAYETGRWTVEGSVFNGREPDDERWDLDLGRLDSVAGRVWFRPNAEWALQVSTGRLRDPEELEPGDVIRTTASASWTRPRPGGFIAATAAWGVNAAHHTQRHAALVEATRENGPLSLSGRLESQQLELEKFLGPAAHDSSAWVTSLTLGAARRVAFGPVFDAAIGAEVVTYAVPAVLRPAYGSFPVSAQVFLRVRFPGRPDARMWNHRMLSTHGAAHAR